ncbi:MAG: fatty acyl-AMP ligase [Mycobacteriaceae bacterium]
MSRFTDDIYASAASTACGMVTGDPEHPFRRTWSEIHQVARCMAGTLASKGIGPGDTVAILAALPVEIAPAVQSVWIRGASVTMLHQPTPRTDLAVWAKDTESVLLMIKAKAVIVSAPFDAAAPLLAERGITVITVSELAAGKPLAPVHIPEEAIALMQLTSGSTGSPKAVKITHKNMYANAQSMKTASHYDPDVDVMVSWLPLFHDMGMVGFLCIPMQFGGELIKVTPMDFLRSPLLWAQLITKYKGTMTAAPNFAYAVLARRLSRAQPQDYDLSTIRFALSGAEQIDVTVVDALVRAGKPFGLAASAVVPAYGMAETTLAISFAQPGKGLQIDEVDTDLLSGLQRAVPSSRGSTRKLACLGSFVPGIEGRIVDSNVAPLPPRSVGVVEVRGESLTPGYLTLDGELSALREDGWFSTGDIGYLTEDQQLVICGRVKDVIIMGGKNIYPTDIERAAGTVIGVRPGNAVAVRLEAGLQRESFAVAVESSFYENTEEVKRIQREITHAVVSEVGVRPRTIVVLSPGSIPKTPSGKLRRASSVALVTV